MNLVSFVYSDFLFNDKVLLVNGDDDVVCCLFKLLYAENVVVC